MLYADFILWFALGFSAGGIIMCVAFFLLFLPKMRELDKEFNELRTENRELKRSLTSAGRF